MRDRWFGPAILLVGTVGWLLTFALQDHRTIQQHADAVAGELGSLARESYGLAASVSARTDLFERSLSASVDTVAGVFHDLKQARSSQGGSIELLDARGEVLAWSGRSWQSLRDDRQGTAQDSVVRIFRAGPYSILSATSASPGGIGFVRVTVPLSSGNRIVRSVIPSLWVDENVEAGPVRRNVVPYGEVIPAGFGSAIIRRMDSDTIGYLTYRADRSAPGSGAKGSGAWILIAAGGLLLTLGRVRRRPDLAGLVLPLGGL